MAHERRHTLRVQAAACTPSSKARKGHRLQEHCSKKSRRPGDIEAAGISQAFRTPCQITKELETEEKEKDLEREVKREHQRSGTNNRTKRHVSRLSGDARALRHGSSVRAILQKIYLMHVGETTLEERRPRVLAASTRSVGSDCGRDGNVVQEDMAPAIRRLLAGLSLVPIEAVELRNTLCRPRYIQIKKPPNVGSLRETRGA